MKRICFLMIISLLVLSCSLDRANPLDPFGHSIYSPKGVDNFRVIGEYIETGNYIKSYNNTVLLNWSNSNDLQEGCGYYIYRSKDHDGLYVQVRDLDFQEDDTEVAWEDNATHGLEPNKWYYYKISAYNSQGLEGYRSNWIQTWVVGE